MYLFQICIISLYIVKELAGDILACKTPHEEPGRCVPLSSCPTLFRAFTNPIKEHVDLLKQFVCVKERYESESNFGTTVCCGTSPNFTVYGEKDSKSDVVQDLAKISKLSDTRYCGIQQRDGYVSADENIAIDEFPWMAAVVVNFPGFANYTICSGALINARYVLTATECMLPIEAGKPIFVRLGDFHIQNDTDCVHLERYDEDECNVAQDYYVEETIFHPLYIPPDFFNNLALLRLNTVVKYSDYVRPICLPIPGTPASNPNDTLYISGLGHAQGKEIKKKISVKLRSSEECKQMLGPGWYIVNSNLMCTTNIKEKANLTCHGDEGAPLMASYKHQWYATGIALKSYCSFSDVFKDLLLYTNVAQYLEWIADNVRP